MKLHDVAPDFSPPILAGRAVFDTAYSENWGDFTIQHVRDLLGRPAGSVLAFARDHAAAFSG